jgi:predicted P-loop ATPase
VKAAFSSELAVNKLVMIVQPESHWTYTLMRNKHGVSLGNLRNALHALRNAPEWESVLAYDEFAGKVITRKPPPWGGPTVEQWADEHDTRACAWMQEQEIPVAMGVVGRAIQTVARENCFHPVRDYLRALKWDGTPRLDIWLTRYLGVEETRYVRAVGPRFLISAVARAFEPGCQVDHVPIFEGPQGTLKSSALRNLTQPWFTDRISNLGSKDAAIELMGIWLIEMAELDALTKATNSAIKSFITRRNDRFRPPYGKHAINRPRQCVFVGTINPVSGYLSDPTGARRFWPVLCGVIDLEALGRDRDQLWAEALLRFQASTTWWLETPELEALATAEQELRFKVDPWAETVGGWLIGRADVSVSEVLTGALGIPAASQSHSAEIRVAAILKANGFKQCRPGKKGLPRTPRYRREAQLQQKVYLRRL